jgi:uncharacterized Zn finger protein (UPF0148 family)
MNEEVKKFCKYCGSPIQSESTFCPTCGKRLVNQSSQQEPQATTQQEQQRPTPQQQMATQQTYQQQPPLQQTGLHVSDIAKYHLSSSGKWINIIATIATIMIVVMILLVIYLLTKGLPFSYSIPYLLIALLYSYPIKKSFDFQKYTKMAMETNDSQDLEQALGSLRGLSTFMGILAIIGFIAFVVFIIITIDTYSHVRHYASSLRF